jgi:hypothetical protein
MLVSTSGETEAALNLDVPASEFTDLESATSALPSTRQRQRGIGLNSITRGTTFHLDELHFIELCRRFKKLSQQCYFFKSAAQFTMTLTC